MSYVDVNYALDRYVSAEGNDPPPFLASTLAAYAGLSRTAMSIDLADYRLRQGRVATRYVIACRGYGRAARWAVLAMPGDDPVTVQEARRTAATWTAEDAAARIARDAVCELLPGLHGTQRDRAIAASTRMMTSTATNMVEFVSTMVSI